MMNIDSSGPDWSQLPHDPAAFFGLKPGFTRADLKRKYTRLLKLHRPERHPAQFRQLRAAYEELDADFRRDEHEFSSTSSDRDWREPSTRELVEKLPSFPHANHALALGRWKERVQLQPLNDLIDELRSVAKKSAYEYYLLALLTDAAETRHSRTMLYGLLEGIRAFPGDENLRSVLHHLLREPIPDHELPSLLMDVAKCVTDGHFYRLTEPLWFTLLSAVSFTTFAAALKACEAKLIHGDDAAQSEFWLKLVKRAAWSADAWWLDEAVKLLERSVALGLRQFDLQLEVVKSLVNYTRTRTEFLSRDRVRRDLDQVLHDYCFLGYHDVKRSFITFQFRAASGDSDIGATLLNADSSCEAAFLALDWVSVDLSERLGKTAPRLAESSLDRLAQAASQRLQWHLSLSRETYEARFLFVWTLGLRGLTIATFVGTGGWLTGAVIQFFGITVATQYLLQFALASSIMAGLITWGMDTAWISPMIKRNQRRFLEAQYLSVFRRELQLIIREWFLGHRDLKAILQALVETPSLAAIGQIAQRDLSLRVVANAMTFLP